MSPTATNAPSVPPLLKADRDALLLTLPAFRALCKFAALAGPSWAERQRLVPRRAFTPFFLQQAIAMDGLKLYGPPGMEPLVAITSNGVRLLQAELTRRNFPTARYCYPHALVLDLLPELLRTASKARLPEVRIREFATGTSGRQYQPGPITREALHALKELGFAVTVEPFNSLGRGDLLISFSDRRNYAAALDRYGIDLLRHEA